MPFTAGELANIANAAIDFHVQKGKVHSQTIQNKPLLSKFRAKAKAFPGGKDNITVRVKGTYTTTIQGFEHDDTVTYANPANIKTAIYPWKLIHAGIQLTNHELLKDGISVVDSTTGKKTTQHDQREMTMLANLLEDKLEDMTEGTDRDMNRMFWQDGTQDAKEVPGVKSFIVDVPTAIGTIGGIDQVAEAWWRNRVNLTIDITGGVGGQPVINFFQKEIRQLTRYGGGPDMFLAGSDMMDQIERELRANGSYSDSGWSDKGTIDFGMDSIAFKGKQIMYDPTLDDLGEPKRMYALDTSRIQVRPVDGEDMKQHAPARPADQYVFYRAVTWVGGLTCRQRNSSGVYAFA